MAMKSATWLIGARVIRRSLLAKVAFLALIAWAFSAGTSLAEEDKRTRRQKLFESMQILTKVYERVYYNYVDELEPDDITQAGIEGILKLLDEHSQHLPPAYYEDLMLSTEGEFGGLGITINIRDHYPTVISPIEGTPAYYMGIQGGDQIVEIEGQSAYDFTSREAVKLLRGEPGTKVNIKIKREGFDEPLPFTITRDIIKVESVPYAFMIKDIGYIRIQNFSRTTAQELREKLDYLGDQGMRGLILDLRYNPGGLLESAKEVSELFLEKGELLVFTKGRLRSHNVSYYSEPQGKVYNRVPMVVLVNGSSASASEILSAGLQDHDAALVVGKTTFGKGSVQTVFRLDEDQALKLTTARYYTPSGRSIHLDRPREEEEVAGEEQVAVEGAQRQGAPLEPAQPEIPRHQREQFQTDMGRIVFGGGGITPDIEIEQAVMSHFEMAVERDGALFSFASYFAARHEGIPPEFQADGKVLSEFQDYLAERENIEDYLGVFELTLSDSLYQANEDYLRWGIRREIMRRQFGPLAAYQVAIERDEQLHEALSLFDRASSLEELLQMAAEWNEAQLQQAALEAEPETAPVGN
jgi:carboxyl-terminal processing protease